MYVSEALNSFLRLSGFKKELANARVPIERRASVVR